MSSRLFQRVREELGLAYSVYTYQSFHADAGLRPYLKRHRPAIREQLLTGRYQPSAVRQHRIPKAGGGVRTLGIPTVLDRFLQQAVLQVLQPRFDPTFSESSYGFRPGRRAQDAVCQAQRFVQRGRRWVVDVDLEKFFDRVNHDVLMGKLSHRILRSWSSGSIADFARYISNTGNTEPRSIGSYGDGGSRNTSLRWPRVSLGTGGEWLGMRRFILLCSRRIFDKLGVPRLVLR